ncbi:MAG TPA: hypothetical protein VGH82_01700 [Gaiellaceae bacterium]|jgi:hypothetical protein
MRRGGRTQVTLAPRDEVGERVEKRTRCVRVRSQLLDVGLRALDVCERARQLSIAALELRGKDQSRFHIRDCEGYGSAVGSTRWDRELACIAVVAASALFAAFPAPAAGSPALTLAQRYSPVVRLVAQQEPCSRGEAFEPTDVDLVLGNPDVALRGPWDKNNIVKIAPTADDLSAGLFEYHLDFPGDALEPGCTYDDWSHRLTRRAMPRVYAHIVAQGGQLALQYWFFYVFNDFNDKHEGDWEMIQLDFDAANPAAALRKQPALVGYSQHESAESAHWGDAKLEREGTHPVVYSALGSHANYFSSELFLGRSAAEGVGCDDTVGPSRELHPAVSLVPTTKAAYLRAFQWLGYEGRWGEQHRGFYNGPTGPNTKSQWAKPITWANDTWRDRSFVVPTGSSIGQTATAFFCGAVAAGSSVLTILVGNPSPLLFALAGLLILVLWLCSRTRWHPSAPLRVRRRRSWGAIVTSACRMYRAHFRLFVGIGLLFFPLAVVITGVQYLLFRVGWLAPLVETVGRTNVAVDGPAFALGVLFTLLGFVIVEAATALAMVELDEGRPVTALGAYRLARPKVGSIVGATAFIGVVLALCSLTAIGVVLAAWLLVRWTQTTQVIALEGLPARPALRRSTQLVRGNWWRAGSLTLFASTIGLLLGPLTGTILLFVTSASFNFVNLVSGVVYAIVLPLVAIANTYLYFDLYVAGEREATERDPGAILPAEA